MKEYILERENGEGNWAEVLTTIYYDEAKSMASRRALNENRAYRVREISDEVVYNYSATELKVYSAPTKERLYELFGRKADEKLEWEDGCW